MSKVIAFEILFNVSFMTSTNHTIYQHNQLNALKERKYKNYDKNIVKKKKKI